ncbi:NAD-dependent histone deacetylase Hst3p [[Candida] jaroonii]|uniref:NAD-dependent histone deacetylase Hst3p n=1 Tax=[Candida] jaroonii TaxID=467808 RepID=A0ACA9YDK9_9ASCO|nr:NAD-dependent histone deacetylase Hst3p [[Candida] jaroonii]
MKVIDLSNEDPNKSVHNLPSDVSIKLTEISKIIFKSRRSTVLTGAGISCNAGIPDFRSSDGLYNLVKSKYPNCVVKGQDLFDISLFRDEITLQLFCTFMESLYSSSLKATPTETHKFIKTLKEKNKLLRCYTQNIDGLEGKINLKTGINLNDFNIEASNKRQVNSSFNKIWKDLDVIQLHGSLNELSCTHCFANFEWTENYKDMLSNGSNPECENCCLNYEKRLFEGKRITGNIGILRPGIVLYGENHPQSEILAQGLNNDLKSKPDLLIIMGTSLKVDGVKKLVKSLAKSIHERGGKVIFVNKTPVNNSWENYIDYSILSDCDNFIKFLKQEIPDLFLTQQELDLKKLHKQQLREKIKAEREKVKIEKQIKKEIKQEKLDQIPSDDLTDVDLTPPTSPTKRVALKRRDTNITHSNKKIKFELPTPLSSFNEVTVVKQEI